MAYNLCVHGSPKGEAPSSPMLLPQGEALGMRAFRNADRKNRDVACNVSTNKLSGLFQRVILLLNAAGQWTSGVNGGL